MIISCYCIRRCGTGHPAELLCRAPKAWYGVSALARSVSYLLIGVAATALLGAIWMIVLSLRARVQEIANHATSGKTATPPAPNRSVPETAPGGSPKSSPVHLPNGSSDHAKALSDHDRVNVQEVSAITDVATSSITCSRWLDKA